MRKMLGSIRVLATAAWFAAAVIALFAAGAPVMAGSAVVTDTRVGQHGKATRIVFEFSERLSVRLFMLDQPRRVVIDMPEVGWRLPPRPLPPRTGVYDKLRYGLFKPGNSRVVIDLTQPARIAKATLVEPGGGYGYRLMVDLAPTAQAIFKRQVAAPNMVITKAVKAPVAVPSQPRIARAPVPGAKSRAPAAGSGGKVVKSRFQLAPRKPAIRPRKFAKRTIVIDPGHGGVDPGAIGRSKIYEKHVTLAMARDIRRVLEATGRYKVVLTRDRDIFIRLRERVRIARDAKADLFISVHADSIKNKAIKGPSVYTLSENASDKEAAELADKENKADLIAGIDLTHESAEVTNILIDLAQRESMNQSTHFARGLIGALKRRTNVLRNTHRFAGFAVLKAPDIPSILLELGFLSNRQDERALRSSRYRQRLAAAVRDAIDGYFERIEEATSR